MSTWTGYSATADHYSRSTDGRSSHISCQRASRGAPWRWSWPARLCSSRGAWWPSRKGSGQLSGIRSGRCRWWQRDGHRQVRGTTREREECREVVSYRTIAWSLFPVYQGTDVEQEVPLLYTVCLI